MQNRSLLRWVISFGLASSSLVFGACFHIGDQTGTCAPGNVCTCDGIGNCNESCPTGNCNFSCTGVGNCDVTCAGGGCTLSCTGTGNCNLDCSGGNCTSNCIGRTNCVCTNCSDIPDAAVTLDASVAQDAAASDPCGVDASDSCGCEGTRCCDLGITDPCRAGLACRAGICSVSVDGGPSLDDAGSDAAP